MKTQTVETKTMSDEEFNRWKAERVAAARQKFESEGDDPPSDDLKDELD